MSRSIRNGPSSRAALAAALLLMLGACAGGAPGRPVRAGDISTPDEAGSGAAGEPAGAPLALSSAGAALLQRGREQRQGGDLALAAASIERAIRIDPQHPLPWIELGWLRLEQRQPDQAESLARKGLALAGGDGQMQDAANQLLRAARDAR